MQQFNLGEGGLIEFPVYGGDRVAPVAGGLFYLLNFGCVRDAFVPEESRKICSRRTVADQGYELWKDNMGVGDGDKAVRRAAPDGCGLWFEKKHEERIFMSGRLHDAIEATGTGVDFRFSQVPGLGLTIADWSRTRVKAEKENYFRGRVFGAAAQHMIALEVRKGDDAAGAGRLGAFFLARGFLPLLTGPVAEPGTSVEVVLGCASTPPRGAAPWTRAIMS